MPPNGDYMKKLVVGILAHVDAGKTTLSEALLYRSGTLRKLGRVDHQDAFLDTEELERERGITIFSKQARLSLPDLEVQLLDTPGHVDFSAETERTLQVLDCAILVVSGTDGVQAHTRTLWRLLERYGVPVFLFVNKVDLAGFDRQALLENLKKKLSDGCVDFTAGESTYENAAMCEETALSEYLECGTLEDSRIAQMIGQRALFPVWFGSALKVEGVDAFLEGFSRFAPVPTYSAEFGAKIYKISRDAQGARLTWLKVTGGILCVKDVLTNRAEGLSEEQVWEEKVDQIRLYSGAKFRPVDAAEAGTVCAVTGLSRTRPGEGLGAEAASVAPALEPVLNYQIELPPTCDPHSTYAKLKVLEEEDPQLHLTWHAQIRRIGVQLMGEVQKEILQRLIAERFGIAVSFGQGSIVYRETLSEPVEGIGHFEPLRHYAEVHLLLEPGERGSGIRVASVCRTDELDLNWQRLILTHVLERSHPGVLTGFPVTDLKITLLAGRAHEKHTEGGDFRQATWRAIRHGLMSGKNMLLEPWYEFRLEVPAECVGRAISDVQRMGSETNPPEPDGEETILSGYAPVSMLRDYAAEVAVYTRGRGRLFCMNAGYRPCHNEAEVVQSIGYDAERDVDNPADSVFCSHGGSDVVPWREVAARAHIPPVWQPQQEQTAMDEQTPQTARSAVPSGTFEQDKELQAIFERTYGPVKRRDFQLQTQVRSDAGETRTIRPQTMGPEYLLVDGYNVIFAWDELNAVARDNLDAARKNLMDLLSNYQGFHKCIVILVFDAYKVPHGTGEVSRYHNITVVYTKESQTADAYIEKATYEIGREHRVRVVTSDGAEQLIILGHGALRIPASAFHEELETTKGQIAAILSKNNQSGKTRAVQAAWEKADGDKKEKLP